MFKPLVALSNSCDVKSLAVIEGLIIVPLSAFLLHYLLGLTSLQPTLKSMLVMGFGIVLVGFYARFASS
jgi:hypothetical protein